MAQDLIPVVQRSYDLCAGLYEHINRFPRAQRGLLGRMILDDALQMLVSLTVANRRRNRFETLEEASGRLDALRITLRLSKRLGFLSNGGYALLAENADEIGRMLGGWMKHASAIPDATGGPRFRAAVSDDETQERTTDTLERVPPSAASEPQPRRAGGVRYKMTSPMVDKYLRTKLDHPEAIVFVTVGAFCQTFFEDAAFCSQALRLAVLDMIQRIDDGPLP